MRVTRRGAAALVGGGALFAAGAAGAAPEGAAPGRFVVVERFASKHVDPRKVVIWLPPSYDAGAEPHAVLYMHDGQNLFDPKLSIYSGWAWGVDRTLTRLQAEGRTRPTIVVGIWNTPKRTNEYFPGVIDDLPAELRGSVLDGEPLSDGYVRFLTEELKPYVDRGFRTRSDRANTFVAGSSMGALISVYALAKRPDVFGGMAAVSMHSPLTTKGDLLRSKSPKVDAVNEAWADWLRTRLPAPGVHKLWFDHGTINLDSIYAPYQARVDAAVRARGYTAGKDWVTRVYEGGDHNEKSWNEHLADWAVFLLGEEGK
jgi:predicted alpha/beta superfamily hydrolase